MLQLMPRVIRGGMEESFLYKKSRFSKLLQTYPLYAVVHSNLGLLGCQEYAVRLLRQPDLGRHMDPSKRPSLMP